MAHARTVALVLVLVLAVAADARATTVSISGTDFRVDGALTYPGTTAQGLLLNSRMANAIFHDENPATVGNWAYPDTGRWDPERNLNEFIAALPAYAAKGLRAVNISLQGANPVPGCSCNASHDWITTAYNRDGTLKAAWMSRADRALAAADQHGIVVMLGIMYHGQDQRLADETAVKRAVDEVVDWVLARGHDNVLLEIANESNHSLTSHDIVKNRVHELIARAQSRSSGRLKVSAGFLGGWIPSDTVVAQSDYVILHGNGKNADGIRGMVDAIRAKAAYKAKPKPIIFNEDSTTIANMDAAVAKGASWGYHDAGQTGYVHGFQVLPVNWGINTTAKRAFFDRVAFYAGSTTQPQLSFTPSTSSISVTEGDPVASRSVSLQPTSGTPAYTITDDAAWLSVSPQAGSAPASLTVSADPAGLAPGTYTGKVTAKATGYVDGILTVTLTVAPRTSPSAYALLVSASPSRADPAPLEGYTARGGIHVFTGPDTGVVEVSFHIDDPTRTRAPYRTEKTAPFDMAGGSVTTATPFDTETIADGAHTVTAALRLSSGATQVVSASFQVRNGAPALEFAPASLAFTARQGDPAATKSASLTTSDDGPASYTITDDAAWLSVTPTAGSAPAGLTVTANPAGLAPGTYTGAVSATAAGYLAATLPVTLTVAAASSYRILVSQAANRSAAVDLDGRTVSGAIYAFTAPDTGVASVAFYVDDPSRTRTPYRTEGTAPFDLAGGSVTLANPFSTTSLANGEHTVTAVLTKSAGGSEVITARFITAN